MSLDLLTPGLGLIFWTGIIFLILLLLLSKFAWKPINSAINKRNNSIEDALKMAESAREEMKNLKAENEKILAEARMEREIILKEAKEIKEKLIVQAKSEAGEEVSKLKKTAQAEIANEKEAAIREIKDQIVDLSVLIAEKVLRKELSDKAENETLVSELLKDIKMN